MPRRDRGIKPSSQPPPINKALKEQGINRPVSLSFRYVNPGGDYCLSLCVTRRCAGSFKCLKMLTTMDWSDVLSTGGKGGKKTGLGCTPYSDNDLRGVQRPVLVSPELRIIGLRASQKMRIFGVYIEHVFYVLWFDPDHEIVRG